jgi:processive 1,2-diacylglycerol beta-glucosyltransferase
MIKLYDKESGGALGQITEAQLEFLVTQLEEESSEDVDYYIDTHTLEMLQDAGAEEALLAILRDALKGRTEMEIRWSRT